MFSDWAGGPGFLPGSLSVLRFLFLYCQALSATAEREKTEAAPSERLSSLREKTGLLLRHTDYWHCDLGVVLSTLNSLGQLTLTAQSRTGLCCFGHFAGETLGLRKAKCLAHAACKGQSQDLLQACPFRGLCFMSIMIPSLFSF